MRYAGQSSLKRLCSAVILALLLGCNAAANLDAVSREKSKAVLRSDQFQAAASSQKMLVAVGSGGVVVASDDGGKRWTRTAVGGNTSLIALTACPDGSFVALDFYRKVWVSDGAAKVWKGREIKTDARPLALTCDARGRIWITGSNTTILTSADKGASWKETSLGQDAMLNTVQFVDPEHGFITGEFGLFLTTSDGGDHWVPGNPIAKDFYPYAALFADRQTGWVSGLGGAIFHTKDSGKSWTRQANKIGAPMYGLVRHGGEIYALGVNGLVLKLQRDEWIPAQYGKPAPYLRTAVSLNQKDVLIAGGAGMLEVVSTATPAAAAQN
ncbi:MAG: hypothetical protein HYU77_15145 [Betaproteobacteria bacterium]|nr:hypothetical protein [Betaproteobacteria bacterium]